jgi:hypothetical protein
LQESDTSVLFQVLAPPSGHGQSSLDDSHGAAAGGFIALDVGALSSLAGEGPEMTAAAPPPVSTPRTPVSPETRPTQP